MHYLNKMRLNAGLPIDPNFEKRPRTIVENDNMDVGFPITKGGKHRFILVQGAGPDSTLEDIISEVDTLALIDIARGAGARAPTQEKWELFPVEEKSEAMNLAERRLAANAQNKEPVEEPEEEPTEHADEEATEEELEDSVDKAVKKEKKKKKEKVTEGKKADKDYDKDGKVESEEDEHKGSVDKAIKKKKKEEVKEATGNPLDVVSTDKATLWNGFKDKDENPKPNKDKQSIEKGEEKVPCPANLMKMLKTEIGEADKEAEYYKDRCQKTSDWYGTLATAMGNLHDCLGQGTHESMQRAQLEFSSWMSIMQHKVPSEVTDFIMKGGQQRGLKDFYKEVKVKAADGVDPTKGSYVK